jgi:drug/metabolite transporter (DMT)-like permease
MFYVFAAPLWFFALRSVPHWIVSALRACGPLAGAPAAYILLGEKLDWVQMIGGIVIIVTSALIVGGKKKNNIK